MSSQTHTVSVCFGILVRNDKTNCSIWPLICITAGIIMWPIWPFLLAAVIDTARERGTGGARWANELIGSWGRSWARARLVLIGRDRQWGKSWRSLSVISKMNMCRTACWILKTCHVVSSSQPVRGVLPLCTIWVSGKCQESFITEITKSFIMQCSRFSIML